MVHFLSVGNITNRDCSYFLDYYSYSQCGTWNIPQNQKQKKQKDCTFPFSREKTLGREKKNTKEEEIAVCRKQ